ncbi:MAG TPA: SRPBCC domain-containing protein [Candidatus Thermoplasmatota archaeon]|nr:SRPBCC domain-containing protein [Candidatus Thermoplasmatota archaeon]
MAEDMVHEATYAQPPEAVWEAIATKAGLDAWMMQNDFVEAKVGHRFTFTDRPRPFWDGQCPCEVVEADPPRRFVLRWNTRDKHPSTVSFTLTPTGDGGTHLLFRHSGLTGFMGRMMRMGMDNGWGRMVRHSIPYVAERVAAGGPLPPKAEVKERSKRLQRESVATAKAR